MDESLRQHIAEHYDGGSWDAITDIIWDGGIPWQLTKFERGLMIEPRQTVNAKRIRAFRARKESQNEESIYE